MGAVCAASGAGGANVAEEGGVCWPRRADGRVNTAAEDEEAAEGGGGACKGQS